MAQLPDDQRLCHGDFHPDNVILSPRGPIIIDWVDATQGHPSGDVARTVLLARLGGVPLGMSLFQRWFITTLRAWFRTTYLKRYMQLQSVSRAQIEVWQLPMAAARLSEGIAPEQEKLLAIVRASVKRATASRAAP